MLEVNEVTVRYGGIEAIRAVSLTVGQGEVVTLLGVNGAGKTSTLAAVAGLVPAAAGRVTFDGRTVSGLRPEHVVRAGIALSPEGRRVFPRLTVAENLRLGGITLASRAAVAERTAYVHDLFPRLRERSRQSAGTLSGGEQQMLAIARALMSKPRLLLLDEPSLGLAPIVVNQVFELLGRLREEGLTMLIVEQNARRALELADRAYVLVHGRIERAGTAADLLATTDLDALYLGAEAPA
jgi:branched-chain amino acid transport system ATP-binding protein